MQVPDHRSEVLFHIKRGIQEFSYDISRLEKIQEVDVPPSLKIPMPQDYVSYIGIHWVDTAGIEHPVFPARFTSRPSESIAQDGDGNYLFDENEGVLNITPGITVDAGAQICLPVEGSIILTHGQYEAPYEESLLPT